MPFIYWHSLEGGLLIGLSCSLYLLVIGRVAGISGIVSQLFSGRSVWPGTALLIGLTVGPLLWRSFTGRWPDMTINSTWPVLFLSGLLVGFGTRMSRGCTSGHGVIGIARLSPRSFVAVFCFLGTGIITATLLHWLTWR